MCVAAASHVIEKRRYEELGIPGDVRELIERSWEADSPSIYGRFDLRYDGETPPKLLEYNADTPTALYEAAVVQWKWLEERFPGKDQFNSIHERLIATWKGLKPYLRGEPLVFASLDDAEDIVTSSYLRDTASQAGIATDQILVAKIGWDRRRSLFVDETNAPMASVFKLYPWEWMLEEAFGDMLLTDRATQWIEPAWKVILSSKGILPILWELYPGDPNLLEAYFEKGRLASGVREAALLSRGIQRDSVRRARGLRGDRRPIRRWRIHLPGARAAAGVRRQPPRSRSLDRRSGGGGSRNPGVRRARSPTIAAGSSRIAWTETSPIGAGNHGRTRTAGGLGAARRPGTTSARSAVPSMYVVALSQTISPTARPAARPARSPVGK